MSTKYNCAAVVFSCDRYSDLWPLGTTLFNRYWPECPFPKFLASDTTPSEFNGFVSLGCKSDIQLEWSKRLLVILEGLSQYEYILMFLDDFFMVGPVNTALIQTYFAEMRTIGAPCLRLVPHRSLQRRLPGSDLLDEHVRGLPYRTSTQASFWRRERLMALLEPGESIWDFEARGSVRSEAWPEPFLAARKQPVPYIDVISRGKWMPRGLELCKHEGLPVDLAARRVFTKFEHLYWKFGFDAILGRALRRLPSTIRLRIRKWRPRFR